MLDSRILVVDDDPAQADSLRRVLALEGFQAASAHSPDEALRELSMRVPDAIISDLRMGEMSGLDLYLQIKETHPGILFILATGYGSLDTAVTALKSGVYDFLTKPIDTDELVIKLKKALSFKDLADENTELKLRIARLGGEIEIIGASQAMQTVLDSVKQVADSTATVLIEGESGTGKELIARSLHQKSPRAGMPYIKVNCAAIPENLLESELFGHEPGAFTGAVGQRKGKFEVAHEGTIFLDEVGEMPLHLQSKFLRVLQEREFERVGGNATVEVDLRVVAATNRDLGAMVRDGEFRDDLFYRLNVIPIHLPPLRERMEDVAPLAAHFLRKFNDKNGRELEDLSQKATARLLSHSWPGNVRELENCMERAVVLARGTELEPRDLVFSGDEKSDGMAGVLEQIMSTDLTLEDLEKRLIVMALERCSNNVSRTARVLGMTRRALQYRVEKMRTGGGQVEGEPPAEDGE